ncbi:alpha/beta fold hydrolase [Xanthobacter autotrophicus DSM 431]|uniref:alpha/beta fold hydrolase n=1 Tax=Xanthobacter nonsaccharivorans TaxID=3119912 RepID=UPI00372A32F0
MRNRIEWLRALIGRAVRRAEQVSGKGFAGRVIRCRPSRAAAAVGMALALGCAGPVLAQTAFYDVHGDAELNGADGTVIRQEPMSGAPHGATAYRVLYRSTGLDGKRIAVSGVVILPQGSPPPGGRPIVAWAHPTTGVIARCAPSLTGTFFQNVQGLNLMLERGYIVVATDYPGLGTAGPHPFLVGNSEGRAVLDSVRAARAIAQGGASNRFAVWGHSQGGQAALFTGLLAKRYAPELDLVGIAAAAPATELAALLNDDLGTVAGKNLTSMALWSWSKIYDAPLARALDAAAIPVVDRLAGECVESLLDLLERSETERPLQKDFLRVANLSDIEPWHTLLQENTPGPLPSQLPVFLAQGTSDPIVRPAATQDYMARLCEAGAKVRMLLMPGVGHMAAAHRSAEAAVAWISDRFAGIAPPTDCRG